MKSNSYAQEAEIRTLAFYYVGSTFSEEYAEDLYYKIKPLAEKIARKYYRMQDGSDLEEVGHSAAAEVLLRLKDGRAKPDMEAWTRYIMMRVRTCISNYIGQQRKDSRNESLFLDASDTFTGYDKDDPMSGTSPFHNIPDPVSNENFEKVNYHQTLKNAARFFCGHIDNCSSFKGIVLHNLSLFLGFQTFLHKDVIFIGHLKPSSIQPQRLSVCMNVGKNVLEGFLKEL